MRIDVVDPSAYTPPYDHSLCAALAAAGGEVRLITSRFAYGAAPPADGYVRTEVFYRLALGKPGSSLRRAVKLLEHGPDMVRYRRLAQSAEVVHFQWLAVPWLDRLLLPRRPTVLTAHDLLPREPRPGQTAAQRRLYEAVDAIVTHTRFGRDQLVEQLGVPAEKVRVIPHGAFDYLTQIPAQLPVELRADGVDDPPVVLFFGLVRPYKGVETLLEAWRNVPGAGAEGQARLWVVGRPRIPLRALEAAAPEGVRFVPRYVSDSELAACFKRADLVVLPYLRTERLDFSGVLATALAFGTPSVLSDVGGFSEVAETGAARLVPAGDPGPLAEALSSLLGDSAERERLAAAARAAADGPYSWARAARQTLECYAAIS